MFKNDSFIKEHFRGRCGYGFENVALFCAFSLCLQFDRTAMNQIKK